MAVSDGDAITVVKDMGLVANVFDDRTLAGLDGPPRHRPQPLLHHRLDHVAQRPARLPRRRRPPVRPRPQRQPHQHRGAGRGGRDAARHGHQRHRPGRRAARPPSWRSCPRTAATSATSSGRSLAVLPRLEGAFSLVLMDEGHVIGVRDPNGFRPLCLGRLDDGLGARLGDPGPRHRRRPLRPRARARRDGRHRRHRPALAAARSPTSAIDPRLCLFEFVYFARPDSRLYGQSVHQARVRMGEQLAEQAPVEADMVMGVPESGVPAAEGFARRSGIPFGQGLVKNRYIGRTLHRAEPGAAGPGRAHEAQPAAGEHRRQARWWSSTTRSCGAPPSEQLVRMLREAGRHRGAPAHHVAAGQVAVLLRHRHRRPRPSCWPPT